jgi:Mg-chelatase subunit ChlD
MSFLTPLFLIGGLAIAGPIIYHLVRRTTRERFRFSSLMFLMPSPPRLSKRHRLEHLLLLLLRCAALLLLALGFARPFLRQAPVADPSAADPRRVVLLLDTSASLRRAGAWDAARAKAEQVLRQTGPADQVSVLTFDVGPRPVVTFEEWNRTGPGERVAMASARLATLAPGWGSTHLGKALIAAAEALAEDDGKAAPGPRQIVLVSDLQVGSRLDTLQSFEWPKGVDLVVEPVKASTSTNAGVQLVAEAADAARATDAPVRVRVSNAGDSKGERFSLTWMRAGAAGGGAAEPVGAAIEAYVPPGQSRVFSLPLPKGDAAPDRIVLRGDEDDFDNTVHVIPPAQQKPTVLWLGNDGADDVKQPLFFLRRAYAETPRVAVNTLAVRPGAGLRPEDLAAASLIFVGDALGEGDAAAVRRAVEAGKTAVLVAKSAALAPTVAAIAGQPGAAFPVEEAKLATYAMLGEVDFRHPLFAPFADPRFSDFTKIHVWKHRKLAAAALPGARAVVKFDSGYPALLEVTVGKGRALVLAFGWQPDDSQLAVSSKFVPLLWSMLELAGGVSSVTTQSAVGDPIVLPSGVAATAMRLPDGQAVALPEKATEYAGTLQPGIYEATAAGAARGPRFAVNLDANESRTAPLALDELEQLGLPVAKAAADRPKAATKEATTLLQGVEAEGRQKLWRWFIVATLLVLLVESILAGWTARRAALQTQEGTT